MHTGFHIAISAVLAEIFYLATGHWAGALALMLGGVLIDIDHLLDSLLLYRKIDFKKIKDTKNCSLHENKIILGLHSLELLLFLLVFNFSIVIIGFCIGMFTHMLTDFFYYKRKGRQKSLLSLFFVYRWRKGFLTELLCA